jgi:hypothetical protein
MASSKGGGLHPPHDVTKSDDDPTSFTLVGNEADLILTWMTTGLPDHLVRLEEQGWGDGQLEGLGRLEVDDQLECGGLLHR